mmetsp:Transcript_14530/g.26135  ORF Transcript_14530/g.26135 Transcript_14530/m.26135 type:complete len:112 (+) Transcript_14530:1937-2272(+)
MIMLSINFEKILKKIKFTHLSKKKKVKGNTIDIKCPFFGFVSLRGRILKGKIYSNKMNSSIIVRVDYISYLKKQKRYIKKHTNIPAHISNFFRARVGDQVVIAECRFLIVI